MATLSLKKKKEEKTAKELLRAIKRRKQEAAFMYGLIYDELGLTSKQIKELMKKEIGTRENPIIKLEKKEK